MLYTKYSYLAGDKKRSKTTEKQIEQGIHGSNRNKQYRKMVRDEILELDSLKAMAAEWNY